MAVLERSDLEASSLSDLHTIADQLGLEGFRRLRKGPLIDAILGEPGGSTPPAAAPPPPLASLPLRLVLQRGVRGRTRRRARPARGGRPLGRQRLRRRRARRGGRR